MVLSNLHTRLVGSTRIPSFAGQGLPERMRSTVFAFMGLTAAAGLALVAIFAQIGFPLLAPAPMPSDPSQANAVAGAEVVRLDPRPQASHPAQQAGGDSLAGRSDAARGGAPASGERGSNAASPGGSPQPGGSAGGASETAHSSAGGNGNGKALGLYK